MEHLVSMAAAKGASDIHIVCGLPPKVRLLGELVDLTDTPLTHEDCERYARELAGEEFKTIADGGEIDLARTIAGSRVRVNIYKQQQHTSIALRILRDEIPDLNAIGLPQAAVDLVKLRRGIVIVTGETGSGKSTTLAALLNDINKNNKAHIITLEDPIEYIYKPIECIVNQREIGSDTKSYAAGLRAALREDPDIILIGEMRDLDTIETALTAAETGHLVFATLHTNTAADSIDRIVDVFPQGRHQQIRMQLSMTLQAVLSQQLLPRADKTGRALACELMIVNSAIRNLIREGKTPQISNTIATSAKDGSITMDNMLIKMFKEKTISAATAVEAAVDIDYVKRGTMF